MIAPLSFAELQRLDQLIAWHENNARSCSGLADGAAAHAHYEAGQGRADASVASNEIVKRNRLRAKAHADTARFLGRLLPRHDSEATTFRDHLKPKDKAQIRAPP